MYGAGLLAIAEIGLPVESNFAELPNRQLKRLLILDGVQDPGNLGTLMRTAVALGWQGVFFLKGISQLSERGFASSTSRELEYFSIHRL